MPSLTSRLQGLAFLAELVGRALRAGLPRPASTAERLANIPTRGLPLRVPVDRRGGFGMAPPEVNLVPPGTFAAWMRRRGKLGGQNKVPRVINDPALLGDFDAFARGT